MAEREGFVIGGLNVNDGVLFETEELGFKPAVPKPKWASNPDADGDLLIEEPTYTNAEFHPRIRIVPQVSMDAALAAHGQLVNALQRGPREDGVPLEWTPADSTRTYTGLILLGEIEELPITVTGDLAGWFLKSPVLASKLTCAPFFTRPKKTALAGVESTAPLQVAFIGGIEGDVPCEAVLTVTDKAGRARSHLEWGQEVLEKEAGAPSLLIDSDDLIAVNGEQAVHVGIGEFLNANAAGANVIKATATTTPTVVAKTGDLANIGSFRLKARVSVEGKGVQYQAQYQVGDGPFRAVQQAWTSVPAVAPSSQFEIDLGEVTFPKVEKGTQRCEVRIVHRYNDGSGFGTRVAEIDYLELLPTRRYGVARAPSVYETPTAFLARDSFDQSAGALTGKTAPVGGVWEGSGDADDFQVTGSGNVQRTAVSDASETGRNAFLPVTGKDITCHLVLDYAQTGPGEAQGLLARYSSATKKLRIEATRVTGGWMFRLRKINPGTVVLAERHLKLGEVGTTTEIRLQLNADGRFRFWVNGALIFIGQDPELASGGTFENGKVGLYDQQSSSVAHTRVFREFYAFTPAARAVCFSNKSVEIRAHTQERESEGGGVWGDVPYYRGSGLYLDPDGGVGRVNRLAVKMRASDVAADLDGRLADKQRLEVQYTPTFLVPR